MSKKRRIEIVIDQLGSYNKIKLNDRIYYTHDSQTGNDILKKVESEAFERGKLEAKEEISSAYRTFLASFGGLELIKAEVSRDE